MKYSVFLITLGVVLWGRATALTGAELMIPITLDPQRSQMTFEVWVQGLTGGEERDSDTQPLEGTLWVTMPSIANVDRVALHDFFMQSQNTFQLTYFNGDLTAGLTNFVMIHADPNGPPAVTGPIDNPGGFTNVPYQVQGEFGYVATGLLCLLLEDLPCIDTFQLQDFATNALITIPLAELQVRSNRLELVSEEFIVFEGPLDPEDPAFGGLEARMVLGGSGLLTPSLAIEVGDTEHTLRWDAQFDGFELLEAENLQEPISWAPVESLPVEMDGMWTVTLPNGSSTVYYQLRAP